MNNESAKQEWHYIVGMEIRGPVSMQELAGLLTVGTLTDTAMVAAKGSTRWRPAGEVVREFRAGQVAGASLPPLPDSAARPSMSLLEQIGETLNRMAGTEKLEGFSLSEMFSETFRSRSVQEMEEYLIVGTQKTTPKITEVETGWPKPWLFMRFLLLLVVIYTGILGAYEQFRNPNLIPGLIIMGSAAMPLATLILFFELNTPRNVSIYRVLVLMGLGGMASLAISLIGYDLTRLNWLGASSAGIVEELGKLAALVLFVRGGRYKYILNGMLFGAAVGTGFACFESSGYAFQYLPYLGTMLHVIWLRGLLAPLMHVAWTAMVGAALWRAKGDHPITPELFVDSRFYPVLLFAMALHMLWNCPINPPFHIKEIVLGAAAWFVIWGLVQQGLREVQDEQRAATAAATVPAEPANAG